MFHNGKEAQKSIPGLVASFLSMETGVIQNIYFNVRLMTCLRVLYHEKNSSSYLYLCVQQGVIPHCEKDCTVELSEDSYTSSTDFEQDAVSDKMSKIRTPLMALNWRAVEKVIYVLHADMMQHLD